jgi:hypothetical protein
MAADGPPRFRVARLAVADLEATERRLRNNGVACKVVGPVVVVPPAATHGLALELVAEEAE